MSEKVSSKLSLLEKESEIKSYNGSDRVIDSYELKKEIEEENKKVPSFLVNLKIPALDYAIEGIKPGNFVILAGSAGSGKTTLARTLTVNFIQDKFNCLWFSYEMPPEDLFEQFEINGSPLPKFYLPREIKSSGDMEWIKLKILESVKKFDTKIVFIDSLDAISPQLDGQEIARINFITATLKNFAVRNRIIIFLIVHSKKEAIDRVPNLSDIRGSGKIIDNADLIFLIWRGVEKQSKKELETYGIIKTNETFVRVAKNRRRGKETQVVLTLRHGLYSETSRRQEDVIEELF